MPLLVGKRRLWYARLDVRARSPPVACGCPLRCSQHAVSTLQALRSRAANPLHRVDDEALASLLLALRWGAWLVVKGVDDPPAAGWTLGC
jgi:hypothetical protein